MVFTPPPAEAPSILVTETRPEQVKGKTIVPKV
jgi:hypothetical protein